MRKSKNDPVKTVLTISVGFSFVYLLFNTKWALNTALIVGILGVFSNRICKAVDFLWMKLAKVLSFIIPNILLSVIFYLFLFPVSLLSKIFGAKKNALQLKNENNSLWLKNNKSIDRSSFEKTW